MDTKDAERANRAKQRDANQGRREGYSSFRFCSQEYDFNTALFGELCNLRPRKLGNRTLLAADRGLRAQRKGSLARGKVLLPTGKSLFATDLGLARDGRDFFRDG